MIPTYAERKADLLRLELTDLMTFDMSFQENFNELDVLYKACTWVFKDQPSVVVECIINDLRVTNWTKPNIQKVIERFVHAG